MGDATQDLEPDPVPAPPLEVESTPPLDFWDRPEAQWCAGVELTAVGV